jgi:hypothetical protein
MRLSRTRCGANRNQVDTRQSFRPCLEGNQSLALGSSNT